MGNEYTFYDYIDASGGSNNVINAWLNGQGKMAKAYFNHVIPNLEGSPPPGFKDTVWHRPYVHALEKPWNGFVELRKTGSVQYRLIGCVEARSVFLVGTGFHQGSWTTDISPAIGRQRVSRMKNDPIRYRRLHDYS
jgi:hypothetical protein